MSSLYGIHFNFELFCHVFCDTFDICLLLFFVTKKVFLIFCLFFRPSCNVGLRTTCRPSKRLDCAAIALRREALEERWRIPTVSPSTLKGLSALKELTSLSRCFEWRWHRRMRLLNLALDWLCCELTDALNWPEIVLMILFKKSQLRFEWMRSYLKITDTPLYKLHILV